MERLAHGWVPERKRSPKQMPMTWTQRSALRGDTTPAERLSDKFDEALNAVLGTRPARPQYLVT